VSVNIETIRTKDKLLISIPAESIKPEVVDEILSQLKAEFIVEKSQMTAEQAEEIAEEIKADWWKKNGSRIKKMISENE
jgi:hypothetical protein